MPTALLVVTTTGIIMEGVHASSVEQRTSAGGACHIVQIWSCLGLSLEGTLCHMSAVSKN